MQKDPHQIKCIVALDDSFEFEETPSEAKQVQPIESFFRDSKLALEMPENVNGQARQHYSYDHSPHPEAIRSVKCQILDSSCNQYNGQDINQYSPSFSKPRRISSFDSFKAERQAIARELSSDNLTTPGGVFEIYKENISSRTEASAQVINNGPLRIKPFELSGIPN